MMPVSLQTVNIIALAWIGVGLVTLPFLLKFTAPYGRHSRSNWGPMISNRLGWVIMETPSLLIFAGLFLFGPSGKTAAMWVMFGLWAGHYTYRSLIFPFRTRTKGKKMPLVISFSAVFFNLVNAGLNGYFLGFLADRYNNAWLTDPRFITGIVIFATGVAINQVADQRLLNLRRGGQGGYSIPRGWLFNYISCPNFFGEIIEWTGFAILAWNLPALSFAAWTALNLLPRAMDHHKWYKQTFEDYPKSRKAVIPFLV
jgi:hypothetical protein